ncbi:putative membrane protein [Thioalkalivibrio sp. ALE21]|uniref:ketosynthase n=1 Tax=Thioalkalivibrio sp. ALE21 TaxID=1158175 RepID=UPI000D878839|nr:ketosynthase [Thioalkalivibrio sp. ALE21]PYG04402.1 putative membrane protein [Thioalkalivibrio sp. ALE21]
MTARPAAAVALAYPVSVIAGQWVELQPLPLVLLTLLVFLAVATSLRPRARMLLGTGLLAALALFGLTPAGEWLIHAVPVLVPGLIAALFARSLRSGSTPLITRYALEMGASDSPAVHRYTRIITAIWASTCALLALVSAGLSLFAPTTVWAVVANGLNYLLLGVLFMLEYPLRARFLPDEPREGFVAYLMQLARADHRRLLRQP